MKRFFTVLSLLLCGLLCWTGCGGETTPGGDTEPPDDPKDPYDSANYDFGDPAEWAGDALRVQDLGDCLLEAYPDDDHYDWGQSILYDEEVGLYKMWWCRQSPHDTVWYAESKDLKHWFNEQKILKIDLDENQTWIKMHLGKPTVLKVDGKYWMYFEAPATLDANFAETDNNVLLATSEDGIHFSYYTAGGSEAQPIIRATDEQMNRGNYGIGQPSALYKDGTFYLYCTYSLGADSENRDLMYLFRSKDGIHFDEGVKVFDRASCGVKYNAATETFMLAYEHTVGGDSRIMYMESADGIHFTYSSLDVAGDNPDKLSGDLVQVHGYADFVHNGRGIVEGYTVYVAYMEGSFSTTGDWRGASNTWDIHIAAFQPKAYEKRAMVLPDGMVDAGDKRRPYEESNTKYNTGLRGSCTLVETVDEAAWASAEPLSVERASFVNGNVPSPARAVAKALTDGVKLYVNLAVTDEKAEVGDKIEIILADRVIAVPRGAGDPVYIDREGNPLDAAELAVTKKETAAGYDVQVSLPLDGLAAGADLAADFRLTDVRTPFAAVLAWNDHKLSRLGKLRIG